MVAAQATLPVLLTRCSASLVSSAADLRFSGLALSGREIWRSSSGSWTSSGKETSQAVGLRGGILLAEITQEHQVG
jgi:hypothetical protein